MIRKIESPLVIIGGGIMGCATAYQLARRGIKATVLEKSTVAAEASGRNAGGVRAQCRDRRERLLAMASIERWQDLAERLGAPTGYIQSGNIRLASTDERLDQLREEGEEELADGLQVELWDQDVLYQRAPYLGDGFVGAKYCPVDGMADPVASTRAFAWAAQQLGATILPETEVTAVTTKDGQVTGIVAQQPMGVLEIETGQVLHAGGPWSPLLAQTLGIQIPMRPIKLHIGATAPTDAPFREFLSSHDLGIAARPLPNGQIYVSGFGNPEPTYSKDVDLDAIAELRAIDRLIPSLAGIPFVHSWAGTLAVTPDEAPVIGTVNNIDGYLVAAGFSGHGFCLGPIMGQLLAEWLVEGEPSINLDTFRLDRFTEAQRNWDEKAGSSVIAGKLER